ncbi:hypothetical protein Q5Y75_09990 [Ruegeria sp. 2205SS24-7]|uniref:hypothetical protein n=1 Tax=Ruegeria discodermiae TaxID=3064389 RepID=UPI002741D876|nr:hypothetical protein [Ruegeria sp. 2205SS24-7]MDP5217548.1 hypothetical protein [Ruegeria sp. 2205SS24-7]
MTALIFIARYGKLALICGLLAGLLLPGLAQVLRWWIPELVALLLFLTAFRIGPVDALANLGELGRTALVVLVLQLALPVGFLLMLGLLGLPVTPLALALALVMAAPSVTGAANFAILLNGDPAPALRLLILGTALLPLTCIPVFALLPGFGDIGDVLAAALRLLMVILGAAALGFALRHWRVPDLPEQGRKAIDGLTMIVLAVVVIGLMSAIRPALESDPLDLLLWAGVAFALNFGLQGLSYVTLRRNGYPAAVPTSIVAGNRNFALFFVALSPEATEPLLIFLGCYQFPMYLTPTLLRRLYDPR